MGIVTFISNNPTMPFRFAAFAADVWDFPAPFKNAIKDALEGANCYSLFNDFASDTVQLFDLNNAPKCLGKIAMRCHSLGLFCLGKHFPVVSTGTKVFSTGGDVYKLKDFVETYYKTDPAKRSYKEVAKKVLQLTISFFSLATIFFPTYKFALNTGQMFLGTISAVLNTPKKTPKPKFNPESDAYSSLINI